MNELFPVPPTFPVGPEPGNKKDNDKEGKAVARAVTLKTSIEVIAVNSTASRDEGFAQRFRPREIETSAGTFGDPSRFVQTLAGVVSDNDQRNDFLVRGGNPTENSFVIDNIEVPSINQLALSDTSGGFVSMLDEAAVQELVLHTDAYDSKFDQRLSSIVEISTRPRGRVEARSITELGIGGFGGSTTRPMGSSGSMFFSARESVLQYLTDDVGLNGVPTYRNYFVRAENRVDEKNSWWGMSLTGIDSIKMSPNPADPWETNPFDITYQGWRNTTGVNWQHLFSSRSFAVMSLAHAEQSQTLVEDDQLQNDALVYGEHTRDGITTLKYDWTFAVTPRVSLSAGVREGVDQIDYTVSQPIGLQNPYSHDPAPLDAFSMSRRFATVSSAAYGQAVFTLPHKATLVLGERGMAWALGARRGSTGKALFSIPVVGRLVHVGYAEYEQLPANLFLLSFNNVQTLSPIRSRQFTGGVTLADGRHERMTLELYQKRYLDYPVAASLPQLSMANIADTFGQAFLMFPMINAGKGLVQGVELTDAMHLTSRLDVTLTAAFARSWYSGLDGILRRGNYDIPLTTTLTGVWCMGHGLTFSWRYGAASGRAYTPDDLVASLAQNRDVYDLNKINQVRSRPYSRLDFRFEQTRKFGIGTLTWHAGLQNAMNTKNFYSEAWQPRLVPSDAEQDQMPLFPDGGIKYSF